MKPKTVVVALCLLLILLPDARGGTEALPQEVTGGRSFTVDRPAYLAAVSREGTFTMTVDDSTGTVPVGLNTVGVVVRFLEHTGNITVTFPSPGAFLVAESVILDCVFVKEHVTDLTSPAAFIVMPDRSLADRGFDGCRIRVAGDQCQGALRRLDPTIGLSAALQDRSHRQVLVNRLTATPHAFVSERQTRASRQILGCHPADVAPTLEGLLGILAPDVELPGRLAMLDGFLGLPQAFEDLGAALDGHRVVRRELGCLAIHRQGVRQLIGFEEGQPQAGQGARVVREFGERLAVVTDRPVPFQVPGRRVAELHRLVEEILASGHGVAYVARSEQTILAYSFL